MRIMMMTSLLHQINARLPATLLVMVFALTAMSALPAEVVAQEKDEIEVQVRTIHAKKDGDKLDPKLTDIRETLGKAFKGYESFNDLGIQTETVTNSGSGKFKLPDGTDLEVSYKGKSKELLRLGLGVGEKFKSDVRVSPGGTFFQAGLPYNGGILIIAITIQ
jgi:hypothetical protein